MGVKKDCRTGTCRITRVRRHRVDTYNGGIRTERSPGIWGEFPTHLPIKDPWKSAKAERLAMDSDPPHSHRRPSNNSLNDTSMS